MRTMTLNLSPEEMEALENMAVDQGMNKTSVLRQALRLYQLVALRAKAGETFHFSGDPERAIQFIGPGFPTPSPPTKMRGWPTIETAPKDRTKILLWSEAWLHPVIGYWSPTINSWLEYGSRDTKANAATHWLPVPTPSIEICPTCNGTGNEGRHSICRDCDESAPKAQLRRQRLTYDEVEEIILRTEPPGFSDRDDQIWTRRMAVALADLFNARFPDHQMVGIEAVTERATSYAKAIPPTVARQGAIAEAYIAGALSFSSGQLPAFVEASYELSTWAACVNWRGKDNEKEWLDELREKIELVQSMTPVIRAALSTREGSE